MGDGFADHVVVGGAAPGGPMDFVSYVGHCLHEKLAEVSKGGGAAGGDAAVSEGFEYFAENKVDVSAGIEIAGQGGKFLAELIGLEELLFFASVEGAKAKMTFHAEHAATEAVGELALA
jgi:hypothetical protein